MLLFSVPFNRCLGYSASWVVGGIVLEMQEQIQKCRDRGESGAKQNLIEKGCESQPTQQDSETVFTPVQLNRVGPTHSAICGELCGLLLKSILIGFTATRLLFKKSKIGDLEITSTGTERQKRSQNLAPVLVITSGNFLVFSRKSITSTGFYRVLRPRRVSTSSGKKSVSQKSHGFNRRLAFWATQECVEGPLKTPCFWRAEGLKSLSLIIGDTQNDYRPDIYYFQIIFSNSCSVITKLNCFWNYVVSVRGVSRGLPNALANCFGNFGSAIWVEQFVLELIRQSFCV